MYLKKNRSIRVFTLIIVVTAALDAQAATETNRVLYMEPATGAKRYASSSHIDYKNITLSESGAKLALLATEDSAKKDIDIDKNQFKIKTT
jgi:hypothetical protein